RHTPGSARTARPGAAGLPSVRRSPSPGASVTIQGAPRAGDSTSEPDHGAPVALAAPLRERARRKLDDERRRVGKAMVLPARGRARVWADVPERKPREPREAALDRNVSARSVHEGKRLVKPDRARG